MNVGVSTTSVDQTVRRAAVLGSPIMHSLSPVLHEAAYPALELHGWHYAKIQGDEIGLPRLVDSMGPEWAGLSLTMPLKRVVMTVADEVSPLAEAGGAANTLVFPRAGVEEAVILGAGGTAQSALAAVRELGHRSPTVLVRNLARTGELREIAERLGERPA